jgi:hypothetical protein
MEEAMDTKVDHDKGVVEGLRLAIDACANERLLDGEDNPPDNAYMAAIRHCITAIESLAAEREKLRESAAVPSREALSVSVEKPVQSDSRPDHAANLRRIALAAADEIERLGRERDAVLEEAAVVADALCVKSQYDIGQFIRALKRSQP